MQGKERSINKIDKDFEERSWEAMRNILDTEMPQITSQSKGKKRYLLLLLFLFVGFGSGIGTMLYVNQQYEIDNPATMEKSQKEIAEKTSIIQNQSQLDKVTSTGNETDEIVATNFIKASETGTEKPAKVETKSNKFVSSIAIDNRNIISSNEILKLQKNNTQIPNESLIQLATESSSLKTDKIIAADYISSKTPIITINQHDQKLEQLMVKRDNKWKFGIIAGHFTNTKRISAGITLGGKATFNLNRKFILGGGLQYSILKGYKENDGSLFSSNNRAEALPNASSDFPEEFFGIDTSLSTSNIPPNNNESYVNALVYERNSDLPISSVHYIEIPIEIAYRFTEKLQMNLGFKAGYLAYAKSDGNVYSLDSNSNQFERQNDRGSFTNSINKFDFAASAGLGFYPSKKIGIDLRYNHGFVDVTKNDTWYSNETVYNKNIQLSFLYFFGKK